MRIYGYQFRKIEESRAPSFTTKYRSYKLENSNLRGLLFNYQQNFHVLLKMGLNLVDFGNVLQYPGYPGYQILGDYIKLRWGSVTLICPRGLSSFHIILLSPLECFFRFREADIHVTNMH